MLNEVASTSPDFHTGVAVVVVFLLFSSRIILIAALLRIELVCTVICLKAIMSDLVIISFPRTSPKACQV